MRDAFKDLKWQTPQGEKTLRGGDHQAVQTMYVVRVTGGKFMTVGQVSGADAIGGGLEGAWTPSPIRWDNSYFETLFGHEWVLTKSPAGAHQWTPADPAAKDLVPDAQDPARRHAPMMSTADMGLRMDPVYEPISRRFMANPPSLADAFARAGFKLTHRDMGPRTRYLGPLGPKAELTWQDPSPAVDHHAGW